LSKVPSTIGRARRSTKVLFQNSAAIVEEQGVNRAGPRPPIPDGVGPVTRSERKALVGDRDLGRGLGRRADSSSLIFLFAFKNTQLC